MAALFPGADLVLPSLWEAVAGSREVDWALRDEHGAYVSFTPEMARCWSWKDELPAQSLACAGKHFGRWSALVAPRLVPQIYALTGRSGRPDDFRDAELTPLQRDLAEAVLAEGPSTGPELRGLVGAERKQVDAAVVSLQRALVLTNAGLVDRQQGWGAIALDLLPRRFALRRLPPPEVAQRTLAATVLASGGEVSAADLGGALGWRVRRAGDVLGELVESGEALAREEDGLALYTSA